MKKFLAVLLMCGLYFLLFRMLPTPTPKAPAPAADTGAAPAEEPGPTTIPAATSTAVVLTKPASPTTTVTATPAATATVTPQPSRAPVPTADPSFKGLVPDTEVARQAAAWAQDEMNRIFSGDRDDPMSRSGQFAEANALYHEEDYENARMVYQNLLIYSPTHPGGRNNYALTLMQLDEYEEALRQLVLLGCLAPDYQGLWVNLAVAGYPFGLHPQEIYDAVSPLDIGFPDIADFYASLETGEGQDWDDAILAAARYNELYLGMERGEPVALDDDREFDALLVQMQQGNVVTNEDKDRASVKAWFAVAGEDLSAIAEAHPEDPDVAALQRYLEALANLRFPTQ